ncbi:MAG: DUF3592 domain-containing protein [Thermoflexales bacterium]
MFLLMSAGAFLISIGCLWAGIRAFLKQSRQRAASVSAQGIVVSVRRQVFKAGSSGVYCPTIDFRLPSGEIIRFESSFGTMPASHSVGQVVKVVYDPRDPRKAEVDSVAANWLEPGCLLAFAAGGVFFGLMFLVLFLITSQAR